MLRRLSGRRPDPLERLRAAAEKRDDKDVALAVDALVQACKQIKALPKLPAAAHAVDGGKAAGPEDAALDVAADVRIAIVAKDGMALLLPLLAAASEPAWTLVAALAEVRANQASMYTSPGFPEASAAALAPSADSVAVLVAQALALLSQWSSNKAAMARDPGIVRALVLGLGPGDGSTPRTQEACLKLVAQLAFSFGAEDTPLFHVPGLVAGVKRLAGADGELAAASLRALHNLVLFPRNAQTLAADVGLLRQVVAEGLELHARPAVILLHLLSNTTETHGYLLQTDVVRRLDALAVPKDDGGYLAMRRAMTLANLVGRSRAKWRALTSVGESTLASVVALLQRVLGPDTGGWPLSVPLRALASLSSVDEHRQSLTACPPMLVKALGLALAKRDAGSAQLAMAALSNWTYVDAEREDLARIPELLLMLESVGKTYAGAEGWREALEEAQGVLWALLRKKQAAAPEAAEASMVMISYNWAHQPLAKEMALALRTWGFQVWLDLDNMQGDVMSSMAQAVLRSQAVFVLVSTGYVNSSNCRREATFAAERKKKLIPVMCDPAVDLDSWLGILLSGVLRYTLTSPEQVHAELPEICKRELGRQAPVTPASSQPPRPPRTTVLPADAGQWLRDLGCVGLEPELRDRDALDFVTMRSFWARRVGLGELLQIFPQLHSVREACLFLDGLDALFSPPPA